MIKPIINEIKNFLTRRKEITYNAKLILDELKFEKIVCVKKDGQIVEARLTGVNSKEIAPHYIYELLRYGYIEQCNENNAMPEYKISNRGRQEEL